MAMVFTLVSQLKEALGDLVVDRAERRRLDEVEEERKALEAEAARNRGTPVTPASFLEWRKRWNAKMKDKQAAEEDEKLKALAPKDREEFRRSKTKPSGRQLFERDRTLAKEDAALVEEGVVSVDITKYDREAVREEDEEEEDTGIRFEDSD